MARRREFNAVGHNQVRLDGADKVTGRSQFTDDVNLPGMLCGRILRCPLPRARIRSIDTRRAEALPGVKAVVTAEDASGIWVGIHQPLLHATQMYHVGQEVAAVAAIDEDIAREALRLIEVDYEPLPALLTLKEAMADNAPLLHAKAAGNIAWQKAEDHGDPDAAFAAAAHVRTDNYVTHPTHNCFAEFHVVVADFTRPGKLIVWTPTQTALLFQKSLAAGFKLPESDVRIMCLNTGGGFTGRTATRPHHFLAALLSRKSGWPVKIRASGDEEFIMCRAGGRVEYRFRSGVDADGRLRVVDADLLFDTGAFIESQMIVLTLTSSYLDALYNVEATRYRGRLVHTNNLPYYFHHGGGLAQFQFAFGQHVNSLALELGMDPVDFHLLNAVEKGHTTLRGAHYASCGLKECIRKSTRKAGWKRKRASKKPLKGIGIGIGGMASGAKGMFKHDTSAAFVKVSEDGKASLFTGLPDMGQSSHTAMAIIAAEVLGILPTDITVVSGDTDIAPLDIGAFTQRGTFNTGNAVKNACVDARKQIAKTAAAQLGVRSSQLVFRQGHIEVRRNPDQQMPFAKAVFDTLHSAEGRFVMGRGFYNSPLKSGSMAYSFGAQIAEVSVDPDSGVVTVERVTAAHDVGRALNPRIVEGQMDGQIFSGMSQALYEETILDGGQVMNPSRLDYKMPRSWEMPEVDHIIVETHDPNGPFGAKEVGEGPIVCTMQAIANAVADAIGEPVTEMPIAPWRVLKILGRRKAVA